jgi:hypothetical protein
MPTSNGSLFKVALSEQVRGKVGTLFQRARSAGKAQAFLKALKIIVTRLRSDPDQSGEARFKLPHLDLEVRVGSERPVLVVYGLNKARRVVFVRDVLSLPGARF